MRPYSRIVLTGASGDIGAALALRLARPGVALLLIGRDAARLKATREAVESVGATVETGLADVRDAAAIAELLRGFDDAAPVDLLIANAGVSGGTRPGGGLESGHDARRVVETNLLGVINTVDPLAGRMASRGSGTIALMSSMAALRPLPDMPAYSAAKAGVRAYGVSLRGLLEPRGVRVTVICPGFVTSAMSARHLGAKPFEIDAVRAAEIVAHGLERRRAYVTFPWPLALLSWFGGRLPARLSDRFMRGFRAEIAPDDRM